MGVLEGFEGFNELIRKIGGNQSFKLNIRVIACNITHPLAMATSALGWHEGIARDLKFSEEMDEPIL
jgi:hypothetical protein